MEDNRRFDSVAIDIPSFSDAADFGVADIKTLEQSDLQGFLMGDPITAEDQTAEKISPHKDDNSKDGKKQPSQPATTQQEQPAPSDVEDFLKGATDAEDEPGDDQDIAPGTSQQKTAQKAQPADNPADENIYSILNTDLEKAGIFSKPTDDEKDITVQDAASFKTRFVREMQKGATAMLDQFLSQHGPEYQEAFDAIFVKGVKPATYFTHTAAIEDLQSLDMTDAAHQETVLKSFYRAKGFPLDKIESKLQKLKDYGDLEEEAREIHAILIKEENQRLEAETQQAAQETHRREQHKKHYQEAMAKLVHEKTQARSFDGLPVTAATAGIVYQDLVTDAYRLPDGRLITAFDKAILELDRPENFEKKLKLAFLLHHGLDLSIIRKEAIKAETNDLFEGLERKKKKKEIPAADVIRSQF